MLCTHQQLSGLSFSCPVPTPLNSPLSTELGSPEHRTPDLHCENPREIGNRCLQISVAFSGAYGNWKAVSHRMKLWLVWALRVVKFEKAFVGGTIVEVHWKVLPVKLFATPSTLPLPFPSHLLKARFSITMFAFYTLQCLKILWVFEFYFTFCGFSLYLYWLSLGVSGTKVLCVCSTLILGKCYTSQRREEMLMHSVVFCSANGGIDRLMFISIPSMVWPLLFLAVVTMYFYEKYLGCAVVTWLLRVKLLSLSDII